MKPFDKEILPLIQEQPHNRSAYSHTTSYELVRISVLVYERFETELDIKSTLKSISSIINAKKIDINSLNLKAATTEKLEEITNSLNEQELANALKTKPTNKKEKKEMEDSLSKMGWELKETISVSNNIYDTQAIIAQKDNQVVLAFRGTENFKDARTAAKLIKKQTARGEAHSGFYNAYQEAKHQIITKLHNTIGENKNIPLFVTGHSLGGALAAIATRDIELSTPFKENLAACYTYGCPRYGTYEFISKLKTPIYRTVNNNDPVTKIPSSGNFITMLIKLLEKLLPLPFLKNARFWIEKLIGDYTHCGSVYFLSKTHEEGHKDIKITRHQNIWKRILSLMTSILISTLILILISALILLLLIILKLICVPPIILKLILLLLIIPTLMFLPSIAEIIKLFSISKLDHAKINYRDKLEAYVNKKNRRIP